MTGPVLNVPVKRWFNARHRPPSGAGHGIGRGHALELAKHGAVQLVGTQPRRGSVEHFYEATALIEEVSWARPALGLPETS